MTIWSKFLATLNTRRSAIPASIVAESRRNGFDEHGDKFLEEIRLRATSLAMARGETVDQVISRFGLRSLRKCPTNVPGTIKNLRNAKITEAGVRDGLAYVVTSAGRILYGELSTPRHHRCFPFVKDLLPPAITEETFALGLDVALRYMRDNFNGPFAFSIGPGATVLEVGAFVGHLSLWFAEKVGANGKVVAIEMIPQNAAILRRNVSENGLSGIVHVVECAVWSSPGTKTVKVGGRQKNSMVDIEAVIGAVEIECPADTLDNILEAIGVDSVDIAFITVNGAEFHVLSGFKNHLRQTKALAVVAGYEVAGETASQSCQALLRSSGHEILPSPNPRLILAQLR